MALSMLLFFETYFGNERFENDCGTFDVECHCRMCEIQNNIIINNI